MQTRLLPLLRRLGELRHTAPPSRHEVAEGSGVSIDTVTRIFSVPHVRVAPEDLEKLTAFLAREFRSFVEDSVRDEELLNEIRFGLVDFEASSRRQTTSVCPFHASGKLSLRDIFSGI